MNTNRIAAMFPTPGPLLDGLFEAIATKPRFAPGGRVRVCSGVMEGLEGTVLAYCCDSRLIIAVDLKCPGVTLEIDEQKLASLHE